MTNKEWEELDSFFGKNRMELPQLKSTLFGGVDPASVYHYFDQLEEQARQYLVSIQKKYEFQIRSLTKRCEELEMENQDCVDCLDGLSKSITSMSQSFLQVLKRQNQRDLLLRRYQRQVGSVDCQVTEDIYMQPDINETVLPTLQDDAGVPPLISFKF